MKRLIKNSGAVLCALVFVISLTGCGQDNKTVASVVTAVDADAVSVFTRFGNEFHDDWKSYGKPNSTIYPN